MEKRLLLEEGKNKVWRYNGVPQEAIDFLDDIAWGTEGAVYEHKNTEQMVQHLHNPTFMTLNRNDEMIGTVVFCHLPIMVGDSSYNCYFVRYFAASPNIRGRGFMSRYGLKVMELIHDGETEKTIFYASIEMGNKSSYRAVKYSGYEQIGMVKTSGFSRFFPRRSKRMEQVKSEEDRNKVLSLLRDLYKEHALVHFKSLFLNDDYYVIRENGEIVAGCQMHRALWVVNDMGGKTGKFLMKVVPRIPLLNQLFNPDKFEFLAFEGIYVKPGYEKRLEELFEGLLAKEKLKSSMFWMGSTCPIRKRILEKIRPGLINAFVKDSDVYIMASFNDVNEKEIEDIKSRPKYASGFDYI